MRSAAAQNDKVLHPTPAGDPRQGACAESGMWLCIGVGPGAVIPDICKPLSVLQSSALGIPGEGSPARGASHPKCLQSTATSARPTLLACLSGSSRTAVAVQHRRSLLTPAGHAQTRSPVTRRSSTTSSSHSPASLLPVSSGGAGNVCGQVIKSGVETPFGMPHGLLCCSSLIWLPASAQSLDNFCRVLADSVWRGCAGIAAALHHGGVLMSCGRACCSALQPACRMMRCGCCCISSPQGCLRPGMTFSRSSETCVLPLTTT